MKLQQKVKQYRQAAGITLREMGGIAGISNSTLCRIEQEGSCNLDVLVKLAADTLLYIEWLDSIKGQPRVPIAGG